MWLYVLKREIWGEENYSKKMYAKIRLWGGGYFYLNLLLEGKFTQAPCIPEQQQKLLWPGHRPRSSSIT